MLVRFSLLLCMALHCLALIRLALLCIALLRFALLCVDLLCFALLCIDLPCFALLCFAFICFAMLCIAVLFFALLCIHLHCVVCKADFVSICVVPALFCHAWQGVQSRFCRYLRSSRTVLPCLARLAKQILSLFA